jgi:hypothetical protein
MAIGFVMTFDGGTKEQYEGVMAAGNLDLRSPGNPGSTGVWPEGIVAHYAGPTATGWAVVDIWESQEAFDRFLADRLGPALHANQVPQPDVVAFEVYNALTAGVGASG